MFYSEKYYFSFVTYFQKTSALLFRNAEKLTFKTATFVKRLIQATVRILFKRMI